MPKIQDACRTRHDCGRTCVFGWNKTHREMVLDLSVSLLCVVNNVLRLPGNRLLHAILNNSHALPRNTVLRRNVDHVYTRCMAEVQS